MSEYSGYVKTLESKLVRVKHQCNLRINSRAGDVKEILSNVPDDAILTMIVDDDYEEGVGELTFVEEKNID